MKKRDPIFREVNYRKFLGREDQTDTTKPPIASVKRIVEIWQKGGIDAVEAFLNESIYFGNTWVSKIHDLIKNNQKISAQAEIELVSFNLDFENQLYKKKLDPNKINKYGRQKNS